MWGPIIMAGATLLSSYMSNKAGKEATAEGAAQSAASREMYLNAAKTLSEMTPPNLTSMLEPLQRAVSMGEITPEQYVALAQEQTKLAGIQIPQQILDAQYKSLADMQQIADEGGLTAIDRQKLENIRADIATQEQGKRQAISQDAARRGISGSGLEEMQRIANQQGAATRESAAGLDVAAQAQKRALEAITNSGTMASNLRTQEYNQQSDAAKAQDMINKFNTESAQSASDRNVAAANAAQQANLAQKYKLQEFNIGQQATDASKRLAAAQDDWNNVFKQGQAVANIGTGQASAAAAEGSNLNKLGAAQTAAGLQSLGTGLGQAFGVYSEEEKKKKAAEDAAAKLISGA